jgi:hypothetical protein
VHWTKHLQWPWKYSWAQYRYQSITQKKTVWKWSSVKEVSLQILPTEKLYNLCTRRWFLIAYYDRRRRRRCLNRVAKLEWSSLILVLASRNVWHKRTTQTFCMDFFEIFFHNSSSHSSGSRNIRMIEPFSVYQVSRRFHGSSNISNSHSLVLEATRDWQVEQDITCLFWIHLLMKLPNDLIQNCCWFPSSLC